MRWTQGLFVMLVAFTLTACATVPNAPGCPDCSPGFYPADPNG